MKILKLLLALTAIIFIYSCVDEDQLVPDLNTETDVRQQWREGDWWTECEPYNFVMYVDPCFFEDGHEDALQGLYNAMDELNNAPGVGISIQLTFDENDDFDITIECDDDKIETQGAIGCVNETGGDNIAIDTNGPNPGCEINVCYNTNTILHEMGHILGFGHTNIGSDGITIAGTTVGTNSVFVTGDCNSSICNLSEGDIIALQTYYPAFLGDFSINGPSELCFQSSDDEAIFCASGLAPGATISASGTGFASSTVGNCIIFTFDDPGFINISFDICLNDCCTTVVKTIHVNQNCCNTCYCECQVPIEGTNPVEYETKREPISCLETESCDELFPQGDEYFDCKRIALPTELDITISGDEEICIEDGYGSWCVGGLPFGTPTTWTINGPGVSDQEDSNNNCFSYDLDEPGTYVVSTTVCLDDCCQTLVHTTVVSECLDCYCECWELIQDEPWGWGDGQSVSTNEITTKGKLRYRLVQLPIDCDDDCDEQYPIGDEIFDCVKIMK